MTTEALPPAFFLTDGDGYQATTLCRGPWDDWSCHGGPVAALIGREVERFDPDPELATVRLTIELLRPVPVDHRLDVTATELRPGKRVRIVGVSIVHQGTEVARATALRIRRVASDAPVSRPVEGVPFASADDCELAPSLRGGERVGITDGVELRTAGGSAVEAGPATYWFRLTSPLVDDEPVTGRDTALVAADFGNGISSVVAIESHLFINPDLTVHLHHEPTGEWIANQAVTWMDPGGRSLADATLWDESGPIGRAVQTLYVAAR